MTEAPNAPSPTSAGTPPAQRSLGGVPLPERTVEYDLTLLERYQEFSAELLRVALIGITAIGIAVSQILFPDSGARSSVHLDRSARALLLGALVMLAVSAAAALAHRYFAVDSMSWHLQAMRRALRNEGSDAQTSAREAEKRFSQFVRSRRAIATSATALALGAALLVAALGVVLL